MIKIIGNTYEWKKQIASHGGQWNAELKCWEMTAENWEKFAAYYKPEITGVRAAKPVISNNADSGDINQLLRNNGNAAAAE